MPYRLCIFDEVRLRRLRVELEEFLCIDCYHEFRCLLSESSRLPGRCLESLTGIGGLLAPVLRGDESATEFDTRWIEKLEAAGVIAELS